MPVLKNSLILCCLLAMSTVAVAQRPKPGAAKDAGAQKFKPPKLKSMLGARSDTANVSVDEASRLISLPLIISDDKKTVYTVSSYQCLYKRKGVTEDEESGKVSPVTSVVAQVFKTTPLSDVWIKTIGDQLKSGEEISFFDIVVKDTQGRLMFAPNIKLVVQ
jgi:hypothetical protein